MKMTNKKLGANPHGVRPRSAFPINPVAAACSVLIFSTSTAFAQQAAEQVQTVVVSGIRKGIEDAISAKKNSDQIVEAISAEDIGKLPDASVAESISRLPGVAMQRSPVSGRAQQISVRGMSPDFNGGLLNGREQASTGSSRSVEFDQYPAELLGSIIVYKTADAGLVGQGLSSTTDLQSVRPLNFGQRNIVVNYRQEFNSKAENKPGFSTGSGDRASLSYIDQFADRTVGVALGLTHTNSKGGGRPNFNSWGGWVADVPYNGGTVKTPGGFTTDIETTDSSRDGAMAVLQWKPNKNFETILDLFYSKGDFSVKKRGLEGPLGGLSAGANDTGGTLIDATIVDGVATSGTFTNWKGVIRNHNEDYTDTLNSIGWGSKLLAGGWTLRSDLSYSEVKKDSERFETTAGIPGNGTRLDDTISFTGFNGSNLADVKYTSGLNYADPSLIKLTDVQGWAGANGVQDGYYANPVTKDKISALRLSGRTDLSFGPITAIDIGANFTERTKDRVTREGALIIPGALDANGNVIDRLVFADIPNPTTGVGGLTGIPTLNWNPAGSLGSIYDLNPWTDADILAKSWGVKEKVTTGYLKGDVDTTVAGFPVRGNVGVQVIGTQQSATGFAVDRTTCNGGTHSCDYNSVGKSHSYTDVLPSLNLTADLGGENLLRLGVGRVLARPNMEDMKATVDPSYDSTKGYYTGSGGNPNLEPFRADVIDLSYEKYFGKKGYISIAGFYKNLDTYILKVERPFDYTDYLTPNAPSPVGPLDTITQANNGKGGSISGVELAVNVPFSMASTMLDGFGVMVNYSNTNSSVKLPITGVSGQNLGTVDIPLPGLSKEVVNARLYYEKHGFQIAVAHRQRSAYLGSIQDFQDNTQLAFIKAESQLDLQVSYEFQSGWLKGLSLLAQGSNLTNEPFTKYNGATGVVTETKKFGSSYLAGLNYKF
ncbi:MAG: TonB-dependent receptor [Vitreoscilla sp.]|nr:TonB-dependent receptor [Vitreoscilla sp.]